MGKLLQHKHRRQHKPYNNKMFPVMNIIILDKVGVVVVEHKEEVVEVVVVMVVLVPHVMVVVMNLLLLLKRKTSVSNSIKERMEYIYVLVEFLDGLVGIYIYMDVGWKNEAYIYTLSVNIYIYFYMLYTTMI